MNRSGGYCRPSWRGFVAATAVAALLPAVPALADAASYQNAFENRVSNSGSRLALDSFVAEATRRGQYDQALSTLEEVLLRNPDDLDARMALARIYFQIGSYDLASAHLDQAAITAGAEQFARQIEALRARIDRALAGYQIFLSVTGGVDYTSKRLVDPPTELDEGSLTSPYALIEGKIVRDLGTASRDELHFGGSAKYERGFDDIDYDDGFDAFDRYMLRTEITYSKGLPDIIDTLRFDVTGYGMIESHGGDRTLQDIGTEAMLSFQPTVESQIRAHVGYGWLGSSNGIYTDHRVRYGLSGEYRIVPGVALGAHVSGYTDWGTAPYNFSGGSPDFTARGYEVGASVSHLLHVFEDGRAWLHEAGGSWSRERILDYGALTGFTAYMANREAWELFWNHSVQISTQSSVEFGVRYGQDNITDSDFTFSDRNTEYWGVKLGLTYRFN